MRVTVHVRVSSLVVDIDGMDVADVYVIGLLCSSFDALTLKKIAEANIILQCHSGLSSQ